MPRKKRNYTDLPPATLSEKLFREIDKALEPALNAMSEPKVTWTATIGDSLIENNTIDGWLEEIEKESKFDEVAIQVFDADETEFRLECDSLGSGAYYDCKDKLADDLLSLVRSISGIFGAHKRWNAHVPLSRPKWLMNSPKFALGQQRSGFWRRLRWDSITENVVGDVVSHVLILAFGLVLGWLLF